MRERKKQSALIYILKGLMPYSRENLALSFSPNRFFNDLEKNSGYNRRTLNQALYRAQQQGLVTRDANKARLTALGRKTARPYSAKKLKDGARLMIIFDIPEARAPARQQLRWLLRKWQFKQIQKSVWSTNYDHRLSVEEAVKELGLAGCVELYEAARLYPKR